MSDQLYSVPGQTEDRKKTFWNWTSMDFSSKLSLTCGGNVNYYKRVHHPIPTLACRIREQLSKQISKLSFQLSVQVYSLLDQTEGERTAFFGERKNGGHIVSLHPKALGCDKR